VCSGEAIAKDDVLDLLTSLVDKSLVVADETDQQRGRMRYRMLEPVRQYALEHLQSSGEADGVGRKHTAYFLALAEPGELVKRGPHDIAWLARMEDEADNLRVVLRRTMDRSDMTSNLQLCVRLARYWEVRGSIEEGLRWLDDGLAQAAAVPPDLQLNALGQAANLAAFAAAVDRLGVFTNLWLTAAREIGDEHAESHANFYRSGYLLAATGDLAGRIQLLEDCLAFERNRTDTGDGDQTVGGVMMHLGWALLQRGETSRARELFSELVMLARSRGETAQEAMGLAGAGFIAYIDGDFDEALRLVGHALTLAHELRHRLFVGFFLDVLAVIAVAQAQVERAGRLFGAAEALLEGIHSHRNLLVLNDLGSLHERAVAAIRAAPEGHPFQTAWATGQRLSVDEAVAYALAEEPAEFSSPNSASAEMPSGFA
jgi:non-specific serine/threonine protein kinase